MKRSEYSYRLRKIAKLANQSEGAILDIGFALLPNPFLKGEVVGVDINLPEKKPKNYSKIIKADVMKKLPFKNNSIDTVVLSGILEHLENPMKALREINRILKDDGRALIEIPNPYFAPLILSDLFMNLRFYFKDTHVNLFPRRIMLKMLWHTGFDLERIFGCGINLNPHTTIPFPQQLSQDIIFVARKKNSDNKYFKAVKELRSRSYKNEA